MKQYTLGLYEKAMPGGMPFADMLSCAKNSGFDRLELSIDETDERLARLQWDTAQLNAFTRAVAGSGISVDTMCLSGHRRFPLGSHDAQIRKKSLDIMRDAILFCHRTGIRIIQLAGYDVYYEPGDALTRRMFAQNLARCVEAAAAYGILLAFETMETPFMDTVEKAMVHVRAVNSPYLGVYPDIGNLQNASLLYNTPVGSDLQTGAGRLFAAHLKETRPGVYRDMRFGEGHTEYTSNIKTLWNCGVRLFTGEFWCMSKEGYRRDIADACAFLREKIEAAIPLPTKETP